MNKVIEVFAYLIGISFITYVYEISKPCSSNWYFAVLVVFAIYGVSCAARYLGRVMKKEKEV